jgi:hypothetical protein
VGHDLPGGVSGQTFVGPVNGQPPLWHHKFLSSSLR